MQSREIFNTLILLAIAVALAFILVGTISSKNKLDSSYFEIHQNLNEVKAMTRENERISKKVDSLLLAADSQRAVIEKLNGKINNLSYEIERRRIDTADVEELQRMFAARYPD